MNDTKRNLEIGASFISIIFAIIALYLLLITQRHIENENYIYSKIYLFYIFVNILLIIFCILLFPSFKIGTRVLGKLWVTIPTLVLLSIDLIFFILTELLIIIILNVAAIVLLSISLALKHENFDAHAYLEQLKKKKTEINGFSDERKFSVGIDDASERIDGDYESQIQEIKEHQEYLYPNNKNFR